MELNEIAVGQVKKVRISPFSSGGATVAVPDQWTTTLLPEFPLLLRIDPDPVPGDYIVTGLAIGQSGVQGRLLRPDGTLKAQSTRTVIVKQSSTPPAGEPDIVGLSILDLTAP